MESTEPGWWKRHGWTVALLLSAFGIALLVRTLWMEPLIAQFGPLNVYGGGSDSFYHSRVFTYIIQNHRNLVVDSSLHYPFGAVNPREPLFDWMNAILGILTAPLFGGNAVVAGAWWLDADGPIWSALGVFPIYLIGKEVASKRAGILAAFLYPLMVANIDSSTFGYANYLSFYTFVILVTTYSFLRMVKASGTRRFVTNYRNVREWVPALRQFYRVEHTSVKWAVFTGVCFGTLALAWQGYTFALALIVIFLVFAMIVERIRRHDSFGLYVNTWIVGLVGFPMAAVYYIPQGLGVNWFGLPLVLFVGAMGILLPFLLLRDQPWVVSIPVLAALSAGALGVLYAVNRADFTNIVTGQGYFVKTLVYSTVAEAQAPSIDALIVGYGVGVFLFAFVGLAITVYTLIRQRMPRVQMLFLVFGVLTIYLPISAAKFFFLGSAGFALLGAIPIVRIFDIADFASFRRTVAQLSDRRSQVTAFRRGFKPRHVIVPVLVTFLLIAPVVWYSIDAGIPYNSKQTYDQQIYNSLPPPLRVSATQESSGFYLGAAGTELDTPNQYDEAGYNWLAQQDQNLPEPDRPAFISWWDYGFQAVAQGLHPTVADNFQNGIDPSGNFLLSQNESLAIGILATTLLSAEQVKSGDQYLPPTLNSILAHDGVNVTTLHNLLVNTSADRALVLAYPNRYLAVDPNNLDGQNAMYDTVSYFLASTLPESGVVQVYDDVQTYTGWSIRYAMVDNRLFPYSGSNTGIFYAPADLTDRVIGSGGAPTSYFTLTALGSDGNTYQVNQVPAGVSIVQYNIAYTSAFYNSMIYRVFIGYNGTDVGLTQGIPGLPGGADQSQPIEPGWMMQHFQVVYRTAYYCPYSDPTAHPGCYSATNLPTANALAKKQNGSVDSSGGSYIESGGESILEYYPGQPMTGTVNLPNGAPVPNAMVTVDDAWGIPHEVVRTSADGAYSVILPPGNDTVNVSIGTFQPLTEQGTNVLAQISVPVPPAVGLSPAAPTLLRPVTLHPATVEGTVYWNTANNSTSYVPGADVLIPGANVTLAGPGLTTQTTVTDASGTFLLDNVPPGVYNLTVAYRGANFSQGQLNTNSSANSISNKSIGLQAGTVLGSVQDSSGAPISGATVTVASRFGVAGTVVTNFSGGYELRNLGPANYSITASEPSQGLGSSAAEATITQTGAKVVTNLTLVPFVTLTVPVLANGNPVAGLPIRLTPIQTLAQPTPPTGNSSGGPPSTGSSPGRPVTSVSLDSFVFTTSSNGFLVASVPLANYSIYAAGLVGSTLYAGLSSVYVPSGTHSLAATPLFLSPAERVSGTVEGAGASAGTPPEVFAFDAHGDEALAFANSSLTYALYLPAGTYTLYGVAGLSSSSGTLSAALLNLTVTSATTEDLQLAPAVAVHLKVGSISTQSGFFAAAAAEVRISLTPVGATLTALSDSAGNVSFVLPGSVPNGASYCLTASALGYQSYDTCGIPASALVTLGEVPLKLAPVPVTVHVTGLPSGTTVALNFSAIAPPATSTNLTGGFSQNLTLLPGSYTVTGWARSSSTGLLLPPETGTTTIPFGSLATVITVHLVRQVPVNGSLKLAPNFPPSSVTVRLISSVQNLTLTGTQFNAKFYAAPGTYTVYATVVGQNDSYARLGNLTVGGSGGDLAQVALTTPAARLIANLTQPDGSALNASFSATLVGPAGNSIAVNVVGGQITAVVPSNSSYSFSLSTTQLVTSAAGASYQAFTVAPGVRCAVGFPVTYCPVLLVASPVRTGVSGALWISGDPTPVAGTLRLVGPVPSENVTTLNAANGSFSGMLLPGTYVAYATGAAAGPFANVSTVTVPASGSLALNVTLGHSWTDTVSLQPPAAGVVGLATVSFRTPSGTTLSFYQQLFDTPLSFTLPSGVYTVSATVPAEPFGVLTNASASTTVALLDGNAATALNLTYRIIQTAALALVGSTSATLGNGGVATFAFTVTNTGNAPEALSFLGSPVTWNFTFLPSNVSLGTAPSNRSTSAEVLIRVPAGTAVNAPSVQLEAKLSDGTVAGFAQPLPKIILTPVYGLLIGQATPTAASVGPTSATFGFYVHNTGTASESIQLGVTNAVQLAGDGWRVTIASGTTNVTGPVTIAPATNSSYTVKLAAPGGAGVPPAEFVVQATLLNDTSASASLTIGVPAQSVSLNASGQYVTGPGLGSPPTYSGEELLLFAAIPAIAVAALLGVNQWRKTRSWSRR